MLVRAFVVCKTELGLELFLSFDIFYSTHDHNSNHRQSALYNLQSPKLLDDSDRVSRLTISMPLFIKPSSGEPRFLCGVHDPLMT